ncbi:MAG: HlyD family efflux transporter periplasmic adaptor subunit [Alphaproteobacteria bacterium]|nr:HlyD family efflux transporter periplasmic adaptor subunit [Alphaproteobacteria bacterium]
MSSSTLFRAEVLHRQGEAEFGETMRIVPLSHAALSAGLLAIVVVAILYAAFAGYSRKETAQGVVTPSRGVIRVVAPRPGTITEVLVAEGENVREDQVLFRVVSEETNAAGTGSDTAILDALKQQRTILEEQIRNENAHAQSETVRLQEQVRGRAAELEQLQSQRKFQAERAQQSRALLDRIGPVKDSGYVTVFEYHNRQQEALTDEQNLASLDERLSAKRGEVRQAQLNLERQPIDAADRLANLERNLSDLAQRAAEIEGRRRYIVRAPTAGRVTSVLAAIGRTADPKLPQMSIVPADSQFEVELFVPARAIGFIAPGQPVRLLYDAFPFQRFGTYNGTITSVANTMLTPSEMPEAVVTSLKDPAYRVKVALDRQTVSAFGHEVSLQPDMTLRADILLERRSMLEWLLEPLLSARQRIS